jgi:hypothetical protein
MGSTTGVFSGLNPAQFNPADPVVLFIIQVDIKIKMSLTIKEWWVDILLGYNNFSILSFDSDTSWVFKSTSGNRRG